MYVIFWQKVKKVLDNSIISRDLRKKVYQIMPFYRVFFRLFRPIIERCWLFFGKKSKKYSIIRRYLRGKLNISNILAKKVQNSMHLRRDHTYRSIKSWHIIKYFFNFLTFGEILSKKVQNCMYLRRDYTYPSCTQVFKLIVQKRRRISPKIIQT